MSETGLDETKLEDFKLEIPLKLGATLPEDRAIFYELADSRIEYQTRQQNRDWQVKYLNRQTETVATYVVGANNVVLNGENIERWVNMLKVVVNKEIIEEAGKTLNEDFSGIIPYLVEHEIYEAWLTAKKGTGQSIDVADKHLLARRREFLLAAKNGVADKLYRFQMFVNPVGQDEYTKAMEYAQRRLKIKQTTS